MKCHRGELGCIKCCEDNIPGYSTSCTAMNNSYGLDARENNLTYNPYNRNCLLNHIGDRIEEMEQNSDYWNSISEILMKCEYKQPIHVKPPEANELRVFSLNIRSLYKNIAHFQEEIDAYRKYDILTLNETNCIVSKLPNGINDLILEDFYEPILQNPARKSGRGGGLAIYINKRVCSAEQIESFTPNFENNGDMSGEFQFIKIHNCKGFNKTKVIVNAYRSPSKNVAKFTNLLDSVLRSLDRHSRKHTIFTGDLNVDLIKYERDLISQNLIAVFEKYGFVQLVSRPTRVTDHSATLIDHVYTNDLTNTISCHVITVEISDHLATLTTLSLGGSHFRREKINKTNDSPAQGRKFNEASHLEFKNLIRRESWQDVLTHENADVQYEKFCEIYTQHYEAAYPLKNRGPKRKNERKDPKPWILPWLEDACARRQRLCYIKTKYPTTANCAAYTRLDKFCNKQINAAKAKYYKKIFDQYSDNSKKQWQLINGFLNRNNKNISGPIKLKDEHGNILSTPSDVATRFNDYFSTIASNIKSQIGARQTFDPGGFDVFLKDPSANSIYLRPVTPKEVHDMINKLKNKATLDTKIGPMKIANDDSKFTNTLAEIVNTSFLQGVFPSTLKSARVVPIHKGGCKSDVINYRPISLLSSFSKIYEKLMHTRVLEFLDSNGSLFENQYGFRPGMSCEHAILNAQNTILHSLSRKQISVLLLLDYSKAFHVLEHSILLKRLEHYGIRDLALKWFESYLTDRHQFVTINGVDSCPRSIQYGIPQGSILGPLLFVIYINDLPNISNLAKFILYADDANIIVTGNTEEEVQLKLMQITTLLIKWVDCNGLALNLRKTHYIVFSSGRVDYSKINVNIAGTNIERVSEARFLGVIIDEKLTWSKHLAAVKIKMARYMGIMYKIKRFLPLKVRLQLYHSFVQSHLNYCSLAWGFAAKSKIDALFCKQKQGVRMVMPGHVNYFYKDGQQPSHTRDSFKEYNILTVHGIIAKNALILMHKIKNFPSSVPASVRNLFPNNMPTYDSTHETCAEWLQDYSGRAYRTSIFYKGPLLAITETNKNITSLPSLFSINIYKSNTKRVLLEQQSSTPLSEDDSWPIFLLNDIPGLRKSHRTTATGFNI